MRAAKGQNFAMIYLRETRFFASKTNAMTTKPANKRNIGVVRLPTDVKR